MRESGPHGGQGGLAGVDAGHVPEKDPRLSFFAWVHHVVQTGRELQDRGRRGPAVLRCDVASVHWPGMLGQDGVCLAGVYELHQYVQRNTVHAEGDRDCRGLLPSHCPAAELASPATAAPPDLLHRQEPARRLVGVHDAVSADSVLVHQPAQLDEEPVRGGVLLLRAVELFQALGGLLAAQAHAMQELLHPAVAGTDVESFCVEPFIHQASDRHRAEAQHVGDPHDVLAQPRHVCG